MLSVSLGELEVTLSLRFVENQNPPGVLNKVLDKEVSRRGPTPHPFVIPFFKGTPFVYHFLTNATPPPYIYLVLELGVPLNCSKGTVFQYE